MDPIKIEITILTAVDKVWDYFTKPEHITEWNFATDDWISPSAENNLEVGGNFNYRMEAKDNSFGFDFSGTFVEIVDKKRIVTRLDDDRIVQTEFIQENDGVRIIETFEAEDENSVEMQKEGWYAILNNYKLYTESKYI